MQKILIEEDILSELRMGTFLRSFDNPIAVQVEP
jgi:hypothetical protein